MIAIRQIPNPIIQRTTKGLEATKLGTIIVKEKSAEISKKAMSAGGDVVSVCATVVSAMGAGKRAARKHSQSYNEKEKNPSCSDEKYSKVMVTGAQ